MMADDLRNKTTPVQPTVPPELAVVVRAGVKAAQLVPGAVALGGTVCSLYAGHRLSYDIDFVVSDLKARFEEVKENLESETGWSVGRVKPPVMILGSLDRVLIGYRQLKRLEPLEKQNLDTSDGVLPIPTLVELIRIKAFLACDRNYVRDYYDFAELSQLLPQADVVDALVQLDAKWSSSQRPGVGLEVLKSLADCQPVDDPEAVFRQLKFLKPRVGGWGEVQRICREISTELSARLIKG
jgi:hypothetical protein